MSACTFPSCRCAGPPAEGGWQHLANAVNGAMPDAEFVGCDIRTINDEPRDQVAS